jgi:hypothetical protein
MWAFSCLLFFIAHPNITKSVAKLFYCSTKYGVDGQEFLVNAPDVQCWTGDHALFSLVIGLPLFLIVVVGIPAFVFRKISHKRKKAAKHRLAEFIHDLETHKKMTTLSEAAEAEEETLSDERKRARQLWTFLRLRLLHHRADQYSLRTQAVFAFLYKGYREQLWWWEITVLARKVVFIFVAIFFATSTSMQLLLLTMTAMASVVLQITYNPWETAELNWLEKWSSFCVLAAMTFSLMLYQEGLGQFGRYVASFMVLGSIWSFIGLFVFFIQKEVRDILAARNKSKTESSRYRPALTDSSLKNLCYIPVSSEHRYLRMVIPILYM